MIALAPWLATWLAGALLLLLDGRRRVVCVAAAAVLLAVAAAHAVLLARFGSAEVAEVVTGGWPVGVGIRLRIDRLSLLFAVVCGAVLSLVMVHETLERARSRFFPAFLLLLSAGIHGVFFTGDLFNLYVFFELSVVSSFALAAYGYGRAEVRGAFSYVTLNLLGSVLFLFGIAALYHARGSLDIGQLARAGGAADPTALLPGALLFAAFSLKLGLFPFHSWIPPLYGHARAPVAAALAGALVNVGAYGLLRIGFTALDGAREAASALLLSLGAVAIVYGSLIALARRRLVEVAAYASIVQAGYLVLALGAGGPHGVAALLLAVVAGSLDKAALFLSLEGEGATRARASLIAAASIAGLPISAGFLAKLWLFRAALDSAWPVASVTALALGTLLIVAASVGFWRRTAAPRSGGAVCGWPAFALASASVALGLLAAPLVSLVTDLAETLLAGEVVP